MARPRVRRDTAQVVLRMEPEERAVIREACPHGTLNAVALRLLLDYARGARRLPLDEGGPTAA